MRLLFVADGRSPIARNWMLYWIEEGHDVHLLSTHGCEADSRLSSYHVVPVAFSSRAGAGKGRRGSRSPRHSLSLGFKLRMRNWLGPLTLPWAGRVARSLIERCAPELVHAMRIPFEGMLAAVADPPAPLLISIWGNDFTLHARSNPAMAWYTRKTLRRAQGLHADCRRDVRLAIGRGYPSKGPRIVLPGGGGVRPEYFHRRTSDHIPDSDIPQMVQRIPVDRPTVINPRGFRVYIRNDTFFHAIPIILQAEPRAQFLCPGMQGKAQAEATLDALEIRDAVWLLPSVSPAVMGLLFRQSQVMVSPSEHDGTPNTLLEAMACGSFPVVGDLESLREWIEDGVNGSLIDSGDADHLAQAVVHAMRTPALRERAARENERLIAQRGTYHVVMGQAEAFYRTLIAAPPSIH